MTATDTKTWLSTHEVHKLTGYSVDRLQRFLVTGALHGHQTSGFRGHWRVHADAVDAWMRGDDGAVACGCRHLRVARHRQGRTA